MLSNPQATSTDYCGPRTSDLSIERLRPKPSLHFLIGRQNKRKNVNGVVLTLWSTTQSV